MGPIGTWAAVKVTYGTFIPLSPERSFAFVADPDNWPLFVPGIRGVRKDDDWGRVGSHAAMTNSVLGRRFTFDLELTGWDPPRSFRYAVHQPGSTEMDDNLRTFRALPRGTRLTGSTEISTRPGPTGLLDGVQMLVLRAVFSRAMARLPAAAARAATPG